jgi:hypothetical protein
MKEYLFLFRGGDGKNLQKSPEKWQAHMQKWMAWMGEMGTQGRFIGAQPLDASGRKVEGDGKVVSDGPYMEGKEMVAGYLMCKAGSYDEAVAMAKGCPILEFHDGSVEVREIQELKMG